MKTQSGFTLIEMVAVVIILAVLAANALPKFTNLSGEARYASLSALQGGLSSAALLAKSKWTVAQSGNLDTIDFNGTGVSVIALTTAGSSTAVLGYPTQTVTGINLAMDSWGSYSSGSEADGSYVYWPAGVTASSTCYVKYQSGTATILPTTTTAANAATNCS